MEAPLSPEELEQLINHVESPQALKEIFSKHCYGLHRETKLKIIVSRRKILQTSPFSYKLIEGKAQVSVDGWPRSGFEIDCFVAYGNWS